MDTPAQAARANQALMVVRMTNDGMTVVNACMEVGIPRSTFYYIFNNHPEFFTELREMVEANEREQLMTLLNHRLDILYKLIDAALAESTKPRQLLAIYKELTKRMDQLAEKVLRPDVDNAGFGELLTGPKLKTRKSRFSPSQEVIDINSEPEGI
jgi:ACT domain-containing protein